MKKVQTRLEAKNCLVDSSLSFSGTVSRNFLNDDFTLIMTSIKPAEVRKSLPSPYFKIRKSVGFWEFFKNKKPDSD